MVKGFPPSPRARAPPTVAQPLFSISLFLSLYLYLYLYLSLSLSASFTSPIGTILPALLAGRSEKVRAEAPLLNSEVFGEVENIEAAGVGCIHDPQVEASSTLRGVC